MIKTILYLIFVLFSINTFGQKETILLNSEKGITKDVFVKKIAMIENVNFYVEEDSVTRAFKTFVKNTPILFYNEKGEEITKETFIKSSDHSKNIDLFFQGDSLSYALLIAREKEGKLDEKTFIKLKNYLSEIGNTQIDPSQNIVINYLTAYSYGKGSNQPLRNWNILERDYLEKLHRIANIKQFWISVPEAANTDYYVEDKINWTADKDGFFTAVFFPYDVPYGNYILIKPNGEFYFYMGEHSKKTIWKSARKYLR